MSIFVRLLYRLCMPVARTVRAVASAGGGEDLLLGDHVLQQAAERPVTARRGPPPVRCLRLADGGPRQ
jgi:hypothetical protein